MKSTRKIYDDELGRLRKELDEVKASKLDYLPKYGFSSKEEVIELIEEDIQELEEEINKTLEH